ncbi:MAG: YkoP family protein [Thiohalocapsa sp.]
MTSPTGALRSEDSWGGEIWSSLVGSLDTILRACYGIYEFTDDPDCLLRIGLSLAREPVTLRDGTAIEIGDPIGCLHFWNEHLPRYSDLGPDLRWAAEMRRRVLRSLMALAVYVEEEAAWRNVNAFRAYAAFSSRVGVLQLYRVTRRLGFEWVPGGPSTARALAGSITGYGLTRAYNPAALARQPFFRRSHEIWISRAALLDLHRRQQALSDRSAAYRRREKPRRTGG